MAPHESFPKDTSSVRLLYLLGVNPHKHLSQPREAKAIKTSRKLLKLYIYQFLCFLSLSWIVWKKTYVSQTCPKHTKTIVIHLLQMERLKILTRLSSSPETLTLTRPRSQRPRLPHPPPPAPEPPVNLLTSFPPKWSRGSERRSILKVENCSPNAKWRWRSFSRRLRSKTSGCPCTFIDTFSGNTWRDSQSRTRLLECIES